MNITIKEALKRAFDGEAKAVLRLKVYAEKADKEGYPQIGRLFRVIAASEAIHGTRALKLLREIRSTEENLAASFESEESVAQVAYSEFIKKAQEAGDKTAALYFTHSRDVEETHARLYKDALNAMASDHETLYYICDLCGYVAEGGVPDACPVCGAPQQRFFEFDDTSCR
ncbi:MAG: rubrerythrin family protein [Syntrophales bacterium]|jgi:rubrerythrin|nr:rubrerythrin family protein [Syntrophales bacterium]MCK9527344.1 rubrerythrin family protein [Syntrophales bacterium]MDX9921186.1 rubrerythrin family protein [Syntrophales bacterium]